TFSRHAGKLDVNVSWRREDRKFIKHFSVRYKTLSSSLWKESEMKSGERNQVENLNSSLAYGVQIQCVKSEECPQCPSSQTYTVPPELTVPPLIVKLEETDMAEKNGRRLISFTWKFPVGEQPAGYHVRVGKASGETPCEWMKTLQPEIRLTLSYSAFHIHISAFNNASSSPALSRIIPARDDTQHTKLNVTFSSNSSFTLYWKDDLIQKYSCFSVEWSKKGHKTAYRSFYEDINNYKTFSDIKELLEPYQRYSITLHTRPNKDTCNMKHINNSESTYGRLCFYFIEGTPLGAPANISADNLTQNSAVLWWSSIPEDDLRGFLLGYMIHYAEYQEGTHTERNVTVAPELNSYELKDLKSGTAFQVQISGFTRAGAGARSTASLFKTISHDYPSLSSLIIAFVVVAPVLIFGTPLIKRAKVILWPGIPNPGNSNVIQKTDRSHELEVLKPISTLKVEEWDANSLQIVEEEAVTAVESSSSVLPHSHQLEGEGNSPDVICSWSQRDTEEASGDTVPGSTQATFLDMQPKDVQSSPLAFSSGYTTMEMFLKGVSRNVPTCTTFAQTTAVQAEDGDLTVLRPGQGYVGQYSTSPTESGEEISGVL
ncbi:hypothetical protein LDENG_00093330, partial [Lucifuga dentata]